MSDDLAPPHQRPAPTLPELFLAFAAISIYGFGGVLAWSRRIIVDVKRWMSSEEFNDAYAFCQMLPGPNIVNLSVVFGSRIRGLDGAAAALIGLLGPPFLLIALIGMVYGKYADNPYVQGGLIGLSAAAAGLVIGTCGRMAQPLFRQGLFPGPLIALAAFVAIGVLRWPLQWVLLVLLPVSIALYGWRR